MSTERSVRTILAIELTYSGVSYLESPRVLHALQLRLIGVQLEHAIIPRPGQRLLRIIRSQERRHIAFFQRQGRRGTDRPIHWICQRSDIERVRFGRLQFVGHDTKSTQT